MNSLNVIIAASDANPLIPNWWEVIVTSVSFVVLLFIVIKFLAPAMEKAYTERVDQIEGGLERAEKAQAEAAALREEYEAREQNTRQEAHEIREQARAEAAQIKAEAREQADQEANQRLATVEAQIEASRKQAQQELRDEVGTLAMSLASKIVGEALNDDARSQRVVDQFLADLEREQASQGSSTSAGATE